MNNNKPLVSKSMYLPQMEHDACGIGGICNIGGTGSHDLVQNSLTMLENMEHRGGTGADPDSGDGAGILIQVPHEFLKKECEALGINLPEKGSYGVGNIFLPKRKDVREKCRKVFIDHANLLGLTIIGFRKLPVNGDIPGAESKKAEPHMEQVFIKGKEVSNDTLERKLYVLRNYSTHYIGHNIEGNNGDFYTCSLSTKVLIYKGQLTTHQLRKYYEDLQNENLKSAISVVHSRFSTNTFPNWKLAQPFRFIAHNGEINTIKGNVNKMQSKEALMKSELFSDEELKMLLPVTDPTHSDSANLDSLVELLVLNGRSLAHVMMMLVPEAWQDNKVMDKSRKAFYKFHASIMEPWDGPAALIFTNGKQLGATLDRNGLRPLRYCRTSKGELIMSSEAGALPVNESEIVEKGRLQPGKMIIADTKKQKLFKDDEIKNEVCKKKPYKEWIDSERIKLRLLPNPDVNQIDIPKGDLVKHQKVFGYSKEDLNLILRPMASTAKEPLGSMGADTPIAVLSQISQHISGYFKQLFAQVSNPPIDSIRERLVMSLFTRLGESQNVLTESKEHAKQVHLSQPVLLKPDIEKLKKLKEKGFDYAYINATFKSNGKRANLETALDNMCKEAEKQISEGKKILIITDRDFNIKCAPIPSLLAMGTLNHFLIRNKLRTKVGIIVEAGDIRETHHFATLIAYGASGAYPYLALESIKNEFYDGQIEGVKSLEKANENYVKAIGSGLLKIMSKMGISTLQSYQSAQIFEILGLSSKVVNKSFTGTISRIEGLGYNDLAEEVLARHRHAYENVFSGLDVGGKYQWKLKGEKHLFNPDTIHLLQKSTRTNDFATFLKYAEKINDQVKKSVTLRSLFEFKEQVSVPIDEVEPVENILKRFATGAMSFGSISHEAHSTLAIAMNRIGAKSNSGEGGEDEIRFEKKANGDWERSAIKQVASGRFGVTSYYLTNADELQIKMAQGAKPGEGGQLPGHKVDDWIGRVRHSTPGVGLISPPPHHDIYSIEDLAQLIFDLKNANRKARINVKLVSEAGVGTVAAGVSKANADVVLISGADGGTGASPISSIQHAGLPWELGLSEAHQTLVKNNLRNRITVQVDGQIRTGRDLAIATLLGAEEWGVSTAALVVEGCIMMRKCHLNTCPVGIATQKPELRKLFSGSPDHVVNFFRFLAEDLRLIMAELGFTTINEMVGKSNVLKVRPSLNHSKYKNLDLSPIIKHDDVESHIGQYKQVDQEFDFEEFLDVKLIEKAKVSLEEAKEVKGDFEIHTINRAVGAMLSNEISKLYSGKGLPEETISFSFTGSAGQSFAAFLAHGVTFRLRGEANDYVGKGMSGGKIIIQPHTSASFVAEENIIIGNVAFYGATSGKAFINGMAGERFAVRNSGVEAIVEGVGDHACEYMTGGKVVVLGEIGKNFAAGMSGGIAYIYNSQKEIGKLINKELILIETVGEKDIVYLKDRLEEHVKLSGSTKATKILSDWESNSKKFIRIIPEEFKRIMEEKEAKKELV